MYYGRGGRFKERLVRFFSGRYGVDTLYYFLFVLALLCSLLSMLTDSLWWDALALALLAYAFFRAMSRNISKREKENRLFRGFFARLATPFSRLYARMRFRKTHVFRRCPFCKNHLRLPRKKGHHTVRCPRCQGRFDTNIR